MTTEYIIKRIYNKVRLIADIDISIDKKLNSGFLFNTTIILVMDLLYFMSKFSILEDINSFQIPYSILIFYNIFLIYSTIRSWFRSKRLKYNLPESDSYKIYINSLSADTLRNLVHQINMRKILLRRIYENMIVGQFVIPIGFIIPMIYFIFQILQNFKSNHNYTLLFLFLTMVVSSIGFMLGVKNNSESFEKLNSTFLFKFRNLILESIIYSSLNPNKNENRRSDK